ncbi:MAG: hypothetical protein WBG08_11300 [Litorimonas sp.]
MSSWLDSQIAVIDCWLESESLALSEGAMPGETMHEGESLMETLQTHADWLKRERDLLQGLPGRCVSLEAAE